LELKAFLTSALYEQEQKKATQITYTQTKKKQGDFYHSGNNNNSISAITPTILW
jgi:hypothetical protein